MRKNVHLYRPYVVFHLTCAVPLLWFCRSGIHVQSWLRILCNIFYCKLPDVLEVRELDQWIKHLSSNMCYNLNYWIIPTWSIVMLIDSNDANFLWGLDASFLNRCDARSWSYTCIPSTSSVVNVLLLYAILVHFIWWPRFDEYYTLYCIFGMLKSVPILGGYFHAF